uniref:Trichome birefringence-like C-terminal domain-containing protein n=1 Tax=Solanum lycopersicum TaxID=4081 RepID=A0A3Q7FIB8_SOLLC
MLDKMDDIRKEWIQSDILIFNSGHWWTPMKLFQLRLVDSSQSLNERYEMLRVFLRRDENLASPKSLSLYDKI